MSYKKITLTCKGSGAFGNKFIFVGKFLICNSNILLCIIRCDIPFLPCCGAQNQIISIYIKFYVKLFKFLKYIYEIKCFIDNSR